MFGSHTGSWSSKLNSMSFHQSDGKHAPSVHFNPVLCPNALHFRQHTQVSQNQWLHLKPWYQHSGHWQAPTLWSLQHPLPPKFTNIRLFFDQLGVKRIHYIWVTKVCNRGIPIQHQCIINSCQQGEVGW